MSATEVRAVRYVLERVLRRYDTRGAHVEIVQLNTPFDEDPRDTVALGLTFIGPGHGSDTPFGRTERIFDARPYRHDPAGLMRAIGEAVESMCAEIFGVHDGEGLP